MKTYHWNGEFWYECNWSILHRIRDWFIRFGGWELANGQGWQLHYTIMGKRYLRNPAPVSLFGGWITFYGWGGNIRMRRGWLCWTTRPDRKIYYSPNGTSSQATAWYYGAPNEIVNAAHTRGNA